MLLLTRLTDDNYLLVHDYGAIEIGNETALFYNDTVHDILSRPPTGEKITFDEIEIKCDCLDDCNTSLLVMRLGYVTIVKDGGEEFSAKIDPRYCSRIYEAMNN